MATTIATGLTTAATAYSNQRHIDRCQNGVLWSMAHDASANPQFYFSTDNGATWTHLTDTWPGHGINGSMFIDLDDYMHVVTRNTASATIDYVRGTPNAARTSYTWSSITQIASSAGYDHADVVAHREGTGWMAHIIFTFYSSAPANTTLYARMNINSAQTISVDQAATTISPAFPGYSTNSSTFPSIDFNHNGDGKTVAGGTPHLYAAWTAAKTGTGWGIRFSKATYSAGAWAWAAEITVDSGVYWDTTHCGTGIFDGTQFMIGGNSANASSTQTKLWQVTTAGAVTQIYNQTASTTFGTYYSSASYDSAKNFYIVGTNSTETQTNLVRYTRATNTTTVTRIADPAATTDTPWYSLMRGSLNNKILWTYVDASTTVKFLTYNVKVIGYTVSVSATAYSNQRKIDRCQNGVIWSIVTNLTNSNWEFYFSTDSGMTWTFDSQVAIGTGSNPYNISFFIDLDDFAHIVYKSRFDGHIYYRRGTPNASRTAWSSWSGAFAVNTNDANSNFPDIVAFRDPAGGGGWQVVIVYSWISGTTNLAGYVRIPISSAGVIGTPTRDNLGPNESTGNSGLSGVLSTTSYTSGADTWPSVDFQHTGDGKTAVATPAIYSAWSTGTTGAGFGIRYRKAGYSAGAWTWGTEREITNTISMMTDSTPAQWTWLNCLFDGTRVLIGGQLRNGGAPATWSVNLWERDEADTTTTLRGSVNLSGPFLDSGSMTYDSAGNVYLLGGLENGTGLGYFLYNRSANTFSTSAIASSTTYSSPTNASDSPYVTFRRGYSNGLLEWVYKNGDTAGGWNIQYDSLTLLTSVSQSTAFVWNSLLTISQSSQELWGVVGRVIQSSQELWTTIARVIKSRQELWNTSLAVSKARQELWNITIRINIPKQELWNALARVSIGRQELWNDHAIVSAPKQELWQTLSIISKSAQELWNDKKIVANSAQELWNTNNILVSNAVQELWNNLARVSVGKQELWNSHLIVTKSITDLWGILIGVAQSRQELWRILHSVVESSSYDWNAISIINSSTQILWDDIAFRVINAWFNAAWRQGHLKLWDGAEWKLYPVRTWTGSEWL